MTISKILKRQGSGKCAKILDGNMDLESSVFHIAKNTHTDTCFIQYGMYNNIHAGCATTRLSLQNTEQ